MAKTFLPRAISDTLDMRLRNVSKSINSKRVKKGKKKGKKGAKKVPKNNKNMFTSSNQCHIEYEAQKCIQEHKVAFPMLLFQSQIELCWSYPGNPHS